MAIFIELSVRHCTLAIGTRFAARFNRGGPGKNRDPILGSAAPHAAGSQRPEILNKCQGDHP